MHSLLPVYAAAAAGALVAVGLVAAAPHKIRRDLGTVRHALNANELTGLPNSRACRAAGR
jgi:hypothetical protein